MVVQLTAFMVIFFVTFTVGGFITFVVKSCCICDQCYIYGQFLLHLMVRITFMFLLHLRVIHLRLTPGNLINTLSTLHAAKKRFHSIPKITMAVCKVTWVLFPVLLASIQNKSSKQYDISVTSLSCEKKIVLETHNSEHMT